MREGRALPCGFEEARSRRLHKPGTVILPAACGIITIADLERRGLKVVYTTLEVGSLGHHRPQATKSSQTIVPSLPHNYIIIVRQITVILMRLGKVAISCSLHIFNAIGKHSV